MNEPLHWNEGLYLEPHHLQALQRGVYSRIAEERRLSLPYPWGLVGARLSTDALENHLVQFASLDVVMPSGQIVRVPENADLSPLNIKHTFDRGTQPFVVWLGVPLWHPERPNAIEPGGADDRVGKRLFRIAERTLADENTGENPQPVLVRRINARLLLEDDDQTDLEVVPLIRIRHGAGQEGLPQEDFTFVPPCLLLSGSTVLRDLVRDLANKVEATRKDLAAQLSRGFDLENMRGPQFGHALRLHVVSRYSPRLSYLGQTPVVPTAQAYLELRSLLAELCALSPELPQPEVPEYDHPEPGVGFMELDRAIRSRLPGGASGRQAERVDFVVSDKGLLARLTPDQLNLANEYFLAVRTRQDPSAVAQLVQSSDRFKLMSESMTRKLIPGVRLQEERQPPVQLKQETGLMYFRLMRTEKFSTDMWERIRQEKAIGAWWPGMESSDFKLSLFMTFPEEPQARAAGRTSS
jgi:type VI secretion system ImpJ/VasE family protein